MSLFTDARLRIAITQQQSLLVKTRGWLRPRAVAEASGDAKLHTVSEQLQQLGGKGLPAEVTLCDSWARYFLVEPIQGVRSWSEFRQYAAACFEETHGQKAADWLIEADWQTGAPMLAVALPKDLVHGIKETLCKVGNPLLSINPFFINAYNRSYRHIKHHSAWLLAAGPQYATLGLVVNGHWRGIRSARIEVATPWVGVERLVQRCSLQFELAHEVPMVILPADRDQPSAIADSHAMHRLALSRCRP